MSNRTPVANAKREWDHILDRMRDAMETACAELADESYVTTAEGAQIAVEESVKTLLAVDTALEHGQVEEARRSVRLALQEASTWLRYAEQLTGEGSLVTLPAEFRRGG